MFTLFPVRYVNKTFVAASALELISLHIRLPIMVSHGFPEIVRSVYKYIHSKSASMTSRTAFTHAVHRAQLFEAGLS